MTWKEFKEAVEKQGVLDTDELWSIDWYSNVEPLEVFVDRIDGVVSIENLDPDSDPMDEDV